MHPFSDFVLLVSVLLDFLQDIAQGLVWLQFAGRRRDQFCAGATGAATGATGAGGAGDDAAGAGCSGAAGRNCSSAFAPLLQICILSHAFP